MTNILHITPHLGGGVGQVLLNWLVFDKKNSHSIITLDFANDKAKNVCSKNKISLFSQPAINTVFELIKNADIVIIHFWNHPLLYDFIVKNELPPCRLIIWAHVSGLEPPNLITKKILNYPDKFIYTTPISLEIKDNPTILSTGGIEHVINVQKKEHNGFNVGYIGTVDFAKMHPDYVSTLAKTSADRFIILGGDKQDEIKQNADNRFDFIGKVADINPYLAQMDIFGYLLNPKHFGTAEQALQEALAVGVVPVVLNNKCEKSLIKHYETGLIANNLDEYVEYVDLLKNDTNLRKKLSENGKKFAKEHFSLDNLCSQWDFVIKNIEKNNKTIKKWELSAKNPMGFDIFLESIGEFSENFVLKSEDKLKEILKESNWQSDSKGTPKQYLKFLGGDELERICKLYEQ